MRFLKPKTKLVKRAVNQYRSSMRTAEPSTLYFEVNMEFIKADEFLVADVQEDGQRHLVFATPFQLRLLKQAKRWFIDGTFKIVHEPFAQLMSIHAFIQINGVRKQFPLAFALMSRRQTADYVKVLQSLKDVMPLTAVESFVLDFERAAWLALDIVFPGIPVKGCVFHWTQAVWRHVQEYGLVQTYRQRKTTHVYISQLLALPFLPAGRIAPTFASLSIRANTDALQKLVAYIQRQWIVSAQFPPTSWSAFQLTVRTNNDVEGWHYRMNHRAGQVGVGFYVLVPLLRREAELVDINITAEDMQRDVRSASVRLDRHLHDAWTRYMANELSTSSFLRRCANLYRPSDIAAAPVDQE